VSDTPATSNDAEFEIDLGPADAPTSSDDFEVDLGGFDLDSDEPDDGLSIDLSEPEPVLDADAEADAEADASDEAVLAELREKLQPDGLEVEVSGPWPCYSFATLEDGDA